MVSPCADSSVPELPSPPRGTILRSVGPVVIGVALALAMHLVIVPRLQAYPAKVLMDIGIAIILAVSLNIVNGFTGQFSIGHAGFMAVGGYTGAAVVYYGSHLFWNDTAFHGGLLSLTRIPTEYQGAWFDSGDGLFLVACLIAGLVAALAGLVVGLPSIRLRGDYLAIVTLGFGEIVRILIQQSKNQLDVEEIGQTPFFERFIHLGGALGFTRLPFYTTHFWIWFFVAMTLLAAFRLRQSTYGRAMLAIRENEIAAQAMGVPVTRYKVMAFVFGAFFAGIAGSLFAHQVGVTLNPGELGFQKSFDILIMVVLGGLGSISGSVLAAVVLTILPELLREPPHVWHAGLVLILVVLAIRRKKGIKLAIILALIVIGIEAARYVAERREIDLSKYRLILYALMLILMMILRPKGLFGVRELWEMAPWRRSRAKNTGAIA